MCGFSFLYSPGVPLEQRKKMLNKSLATLAHRGPNEDGALHDEETSAGHRRLSILDLASSHQPMQDPSGRYTLIYNGEIYNYQELRNNLSGHWQFNTHGDTEVVLAGLCVHGEKFFSKMLGMWALALWDAKDKKLLLSRDRMGKKPLYYHQDSNNFACSSEIPSLRHIAYHAWSEDLDSTSDYLRYGFSLPGHTAYKEVKEVLPGHFVIWKPNAQLAQSPYWQLQPSAFRGSKADALELIRSIFIQAVKRRMVSDVEVGAFLSGGIDSSLIVAAMVTDLQLHPKTFTIGFNQTTYDERKYASIVSRQFATEHYEEELSGFDPAQLVNLILNHHGQPFGDASLLPTALVSQLAAKHVKVVLSGDGGDELFSGYQRYQAKLLQRTYFRLPHQARMILERLIDSFPEPTAHHSRSLIKKAKLFVTAYSKPDTVNHYIAPMNCQPQILEQLTPSIYPRGHDKSEIEDIKSEDEVMEMMLKDASVYLPQDILAKVDRASMAFSLESRAPFLDTNLVELAFSFPRSWHRLGFEGKKLLRSAFKNYLPNSVWNRRKQGFAVPLSQWFKGKLGDELIESSNVLGNSPIDNSYVIKLIKEHRAGKADFSMILWSVYVYSKWKSYFEHSK